MIKDYPHAVGRNTILIAALQARNNARVIVLGSIDFLSDQYLTAKVGKDGKVAGNSEVMSDIVSWCFKQSGVIKIDLVEHKSVETGKNLKGDCGLAAFCNLKPNARRNLSLPYSIDFWHYL